MRRNGEREGEGGTPEKEEGRSERATTEPLFFFLPLLYFSPFFTQIRPRLLSCSHAKLKERKGETPAVSEGKKECFRGLKLNKWCESGEQSRKERGANFREVCFHQKRFDYELCISAN